jgi:2-oxoglutarate ferredoxin oxidoreductase subunit gamma
MEKRLLVAGFGGQGVMVIGQMIGQASWMADKKVTFLPQYGPEQRGGTANCIVTISDKEIGSPMGRTIDALIVLNDVSLKKYLPMVKAGGIVIVNTSICRDKVQRDDVEVCYVAANDIAREIGNEKVANLVIIGAYISKAKTITEDQMWEAVKVKLGKKKDLLEMNRAALKKGIEVTC